MPSSSKESVVSVAVAIPTYLREEVLVDTIQQVLDQRPPADEILVIDQTPEHRPETEAFLRDNHESARLRWIHHAPPNLPAARNRALVETRCDVVIFLDDDVVLTPQFVDHHRRNYSDPSIVAVAGRTLQPWSRPDQGPRRSGPRRLDYLRFGHDRGGERVSGIASFMGGNHSVRIRSMRELGGYDEGFRYTSGREDSDAALRLWSQGSMIVYDPASELRHLAAPTGGCQGRTTVFATWKRYYSEHYFLLRHFWPGRHFWAQVLWRSFRPSVLSKANIHKPWRLPGAFLAYVWAFVQAVAAVRAARPLPAAGYSSVIASRAD